MTIQDVAKRAQERWSAESRITLPDVELIGEERLHEPLTGERIRKDRWNINHGAVAG